MNLMKRAEPPIAFERSGSIAILRLNRPAVMNAVCAEMASALLQAIDHVEDPENGYRAVVLTGEGRGFCAGANLTALIPDERLGKQSLGQILNVVFDPLICRLRNMRLPIIAAINGPVVGMGISFALLADYVVAASDAYFLLPYREIGLLPDGGLTWLLPRVIGLARARGLALLGEKLSAKTALEWGLINHMEDSANLHGAAMRIAERIAKGPTCALALTRRAFERSLNHDFEDQLALESALQHEAGETRDHFEGIRAMRARRKPEFIGR